MEEEPDSEARTIYCGNLSSKVTEEILYELFLQAGPVERVKIPPNNNKISYGFVTYTHSCSVDYAIEIFKDTELYGNLLKLKRRNRNQDFNNSRNGNANYTPVLQAETNAVYMSNMLCMMPQNLMGLNPYMCPNPMYNVTPKMSDNGRRSPPRDRYRHSPVNKGRYQSSHGRNSHASGGRYDDRSNRRYGVKYDHRSNHNDRHDHKRHKR